MRYERLLTDKSTASSPYARLAEFGRIWQLVVLLYAFLATLALWTLAQAPPGIQHLLLLCLLRIAVLLCVGAVTYQAHRRRRAEGTPPLLAPAAPQQPGGSNPASPRGSLAQAALYLQLAWLGSELVLGSSLLLFHRRILGSLAAEGSSASAAGTLLALLPLLCAVAMSGCLLFLHRFGRRRRERAPGSPLGCGSVSTRPLAAGLPPHYAAAMALPGHHTLDVLCSPASDDDSASFSSATSSASSAAAFYSRSSSSSLGGPPSCGVPSPTGHLSSRSAEAAAHQAAIHAACQVLLVEHQVLSRPDTAECVLFVHKKLRPIRTRPQEKQATSPPGLLRELITNSFTFQHDPQLAAQLAAAAAAPGGAGSSRASGATSVTFQAAAAAVGLTAV